MPTERILRLPLADDSPASFVLLHTLEEIASPSRLKLTASDGGNDVFRTTIKLDHISKLRDAKFVGTDDDFSAVVRQTLLLHRQHEPLSQGLESIEFVAVINRPRTGAEKLPSMSLMWRRKVNDWNQKLGQIDIPQYSGGDQPDAFEWAEIAARNFRDSRKRVETLETQLATQAETIDKLQSQLDSIVQAKDQHEAVLLHKFAEIINSKKAKIRDQQRLLATAKIDPNTAARIAPVTSKSYKAAESRSSKRKANARAEPSEDESSDGFEDAVNKEQDEEINDAVTPQDTDEDTEDDQPPPSPVRTGMRRKIGGTTVAEKEKTKPPGPVTTRSTRAASKAPEKAPEEEIPPPKRELPFAKAKPAVSESRPTRDEDETDDDDDEL